MSEFDESQIEYLEDLALKVRNAKWGEQEAQDAYKDAKNDLWNFADEYVGEEGLLAHQDHWYKGATESEARDRAGIDFPDFEVESVKVDKKGATVFLKENPAYKGFEYYSEEHDVKIGRSVSPGKETFDVARFIDEQEELAEQSITVTTITVERPGAEPKVTTTFDLDQDAVEALIADDKSLQQVFAEYVLPGVPQTKMLPVARRKKVKA